ncbi:hypothetical protein WL98_28445 [Burkholderia multivorans]|nr:hypothetical protein WL98_28445 [Burkholderia multivorans]PRE95790.1 hypothetical protein C6Q05_22735 [Burkholderia multivorans]
MASRIRKHRLTPLKGSGLTFRRDIFGVGARVGRRKAATPVETIAIPKFSAHAARHDAALRSRRHTRASRSACEAGAGDAARARRAAAGSG